MLTRRSLVPASALDFREEVDRLFDQFFEAKTLAPFRFDIPEATAWAPSLDVREKPDAIVITADVPGVNPDRIDVTVTDGVLSIKGDREETKREDTENVHRVERRFGTFLRRVQLPAAVDEGKVTAACKDGVLTIELKKSEAVMPRRIPVKATAR